MRDKDESQPAHPLARYARSNLVLHPTGPDYADSACSLAAVRGTHGRRRGENAAYSIFSPPRISHIARSQITSERLPHCQKLYSSRRELVLLFTNLFTVPFACECFLHAFLFAWFQVKGVALDLFDNVLRLHLPLETTKSILQRLAFLNTNFCQD